MSDPILLGIGAGVIIGAIGIVVTLANGLKKSDASTSAPTTAPRTSQPMPADQPQTVFPAPPPSVKESAEEPTQRVHGSAPTLTAIVDEPDAPEPPDVHPADEDVEDVEDEPGFPSEDAELAPETVQPEPETDAERAAKAPYASGLVAPVELWIGDTRIVVKDGTRTQLKFRSYADSLLSALKEAKDETDKGV